VTAYTTGQSLPLVGYVAAAAKLEAMGTASLLPSRELGWFGLCVTLGIAAYPNLLIRSTATQSTESARSSLAWALLLVALLCVACASLAAVARWVVDDSPLQAGSIAELVAQPWIVDWVAASRQAGPAAHAAPGR
jgi:Na+(H+)/acetate symporter ActP